MINLRALNNATPKKKASPFTILEETASLLLRAARARRYKVTHREEYNAAKRSSQRKKYNENAAWREQYRAKQNKLAAVRREIRESTPKESHWDDDLKQEMALALLEGKDPNQAKEQWRRAENKHFYGTTEYPHTEKGELKI